MNNKEIGNAMTIKLDPVLPEYPVFKEGIRRAPMRELTLSDHEKKLAVKNALRYVPEELHEALAPEFMEELLTRGRIYGYRFMPKDRIYGKPIDEYKGNCVQGKAFQVMIDNNLNHEVALYPYELVTYGETGQVCQNWMQYQLLKKYLEVLTDEQTLVVMSGHPLGLFHSHKQAPRVIITNGLMVGEGDNPQAWAKATAMGCSSYGQMTAGGWMYIGPQGIVHGTFNTILNAGRKFLGVPADGDLAGQVSVGNTVAVAAEKTYWILDSEISNAEKFGYKGACQLEGAYIISNDKGNTDFDKSWITETTVKEIVDTPVTENITNKIFKATALVKKAPGNGFINYYIDDIDGVTGSYVYTQCNGGDFAWLDEFDGKFCTVYFVAINAKSSSSGCFWRFLPISVSDDGYVFDTNKAAEFAVKYHGVGQFLAEYTGDPAIELVTSVSSELLGFEGATLAYSSSNESVVYFTTDENGVVTFHCGEAGSADITVTATHNGNIYTENLTVTVKENVEVDSITVADAIATPYDTDVVVKGIVGPSLVNRTGFYLFGEDGSMIAVLVSEDAFEGLAIGHEIIVSGMRERFIKDDTYTTYGQDAIVNGEIIANYYGNHAYSTEKFITDKTLEDIKALDVTESHSTEVYVVKAVVEVVETAYYTNLKITYNGTELALYCSSASQYNWLKAYAGQEITMEIAPCNWNDKKDAYRGCVLAVVNEDGTKVLNTLNFN